jgi:hypothetical protein
VGLDRQAHAANCERVSAPKDSTDYLSDIVRAFTSILALLASGLFALAGESAIKPILSFSLTATNQNFSHRLALGLTLRVERDVLGWEVGVFKGRSTDSLLYPHRNWHGAFPCQLSAWSHRTQTFPDERTIPVRGYKGSVRIRLIDAVVTGKSGVERFTGGRAEIYWNDDV